MKVLCIINDGFEEIETISPIDILKRADIDVTIASNNKSATGAHGITFSDLTVLRDIDYKNFDLLILPGGPQWKANTNDALYQEIMSYYAKNKVVAAICASPTLLGAKGFLKGKKYTCFPPMNADFGGTFTGSAAVTDGNIITGRGAGASLEFGFEIISYLLGQDAADKLKASMYY